MTTTTTTTAKKEVVMTKEQIALEYYEHSLDMCKEHIQEFIADSKKEEMALIVDDVEALFNNYVKRIKNINDDDKLNNSYAVEKIWKLRLIERIVKF